MPKPFGPPQPSTLFALFSEKQGYFRSITAANGYYPRAVAEDQLKRLPEKDKYRIVKLNPQ